MASAPSMGDSQNDAAMQLFNKPYHELNEMELQMFHLYLIIILEVKMKLVN